MKKPFVFGCVAMALAVDGLCAGAVSLESLLDELADRDAVTKVAAVPYRMRLCGSYDRRSVTPDRPGWFANDDCNKFVRLETNSNGGVERVLMDETGPGAVVRFWETMDKVENGGHLRFYIDGKLLLEGNGFDVLSGGAVCGAPLADAVAHQTRIDQRGHNLYLPIPYAKGCKVTVEYPEGGGRRFYYNIETRKYPANAVVQSLTKVGLAAAAERIAAVNAALAKEVSDDLPSGCVTQAEENVKLMPGDSWTHDFGGPGAIREIAFTGFAPMWNDSVPPLRDVRIRLEFDGERTVDMPAVLFFGAGLSPCAFGTRFCADRVKGDEHTFTARWVMPYVRSARVTFVNGSEQSCRLGRVAVTTGEYAWDGARSMRFHATCNDYLRIRTRANGTHRDLNYLKIDGRRGTFVGCGLCVLNTERAWWGEGDEKVFVDGEKVPSYIGTGTEDHYGYAWCRPSSFSHPFVAQPDGSGNLMPGQSVNLRHRVLDAIPFERSLQFDMELWHWKDCVVDYQTVSWYYLK